MIPLKNKPSKEAVNVAPKNIPICRPRLSWLMCLAMMIKPKGNTDAPKIPVMSLAKKRVAMFPENPARRLAREKISMQISSTFRASKARTSGP